MSVKRRTFSALGLGGLCLGQVTHAVTPVRCTMSASVVALKVVDAKGEPVKGAQLTLRRLSTGATLPFAGPMGDQGDYKLLEDADLPDLRAEGEDFEVRLQKEARSRVLRLRIGKDVQRCHIRLLQGEARVTL